MWPYSWRVGGPGEACSQQIAESASFFGIGVGEGKVSALEQSCDGLGVLAVALGFAAVDGFHAPGMSEQEGDVVIAADVGQPVPAVHAFAADDESLAEGCDGCAEGFGGGGEIACEACLSLVVEDDEEECSGVEIDAGIESGVRWWLEVAHEDLSL